MNLSEVLDALQVIVGNSSHSRHEYVGVFSDGSVAIGEGMWKQVRPFKTVKEAEAYLKGVLSSAKLKTLKGKVVRFYYEGGTIEATRVVKVDDVKTTKEGKWQLVGTDVIKNEPRCYNYDSIKGEIQVVA